MRYSLVIALCAILISGTAHSDSVRANQPQLRGIKAVHPFVSVGPLETYPDPRADSRVATLERAITDKLRAAGIAVLPTMDEPAPNLRLEAHLKTDPNRSGVSAVVVRIRLDEGIRIERLSKPRVVTNGTTWDWEDIDLLPDDEAWSHAQADVDEAITRFIENVAFERGPGK
jgi:hypothetical protein